MKVHTLKRTQRFPYLIDQVFSFFQMPENLSLITPPSLDFKILTPSPIVMHQGVLIDYTIRWLTIPIHWTTLVTTYDPPHRFVDEQLRGPYALWHHTHTFEEKDGWTEMTDEVRYALPLGGLGAFVRWAMVRHQLDEIFDHRSRVIGQVFGLDNASQERPRPFPRGVAYGEKPQ